MVIKYVFNDFIFLINKKKLFIFLYQIADFNCSFYYLFFFLFFFVISNCSKVYFIFFFSNWIAVTLLLMGNSFKGLLFHIVMESIW